MRYFSLYWLALVAVALCSLKTFSSAAPLSDWVQGEVLNFGGKTLIVFDIELSSEVSCIAIMKQILI